MNYHGILSMLIAAFLAVVHAKASCNTREVLFRTTTECMIEINSLAYSDNGCSKISKMDSIIADCLTLPEECKKEKDYTDFVAPSIDKTRLLVESLRIKCSSGTNAVSNGGRNGRAGCSYSDAQACVNTYSTIQSIPPITLVNVFTICDTLDQYVTNIQTCKDFTIACASASDPDVQRVMPTIVQFVDYAEEMQSKGCDCARRVSTCVSNVLGSDVCEDIRRGSACALVVADVCVKNVVFVYVQLNWLDYTVSYLRTYLGFVPLGCQIVAVGINLFGGSAIAQISLALFILALTTNWVIRRFRY